MKRYTRDRMATQSKWEVGALEEIVAFQAHECSRPFYAIGMIEEHAPGKHLWRALQEYFPGARLEDCTTSNQLRTDWATCTVGDYVFYMSDTGIKVGLLQVVVRIGNVAPKCILATFDWVSTTGEWANWRADAKLVMIPSDDCMYSAICMVAGADVTVFIPYFMRH